MRFVFTLTLTTITAFLAAASDVSAQYGYYRPYHGYGAYGSSYGGFGAGTTAAGSYMAGMGQAIQAQGAYNQMTAAAAIDAEKARSLAIDNKTKAAQAYYELQRMNREEKAAREEREAKLRVTKVPPPKIPRLTASQLDPVTGQIAWPKVFISPLFEIQRKQLDLLFATKAKDPLHDIYQEARTTAFAMRDTLDTLHDMIPTADFFAARHFLESLAEAPRYMSFDATASTASTTH